MARVSTYLNFPGNTEEAFEHYKSVFGTEYLGEIMRFGDVPVGEGQEPAPEAEKNAIMNIALPILGGHLLMGTDITPSMGRELRAGNNVSIVLEPDTRDEADRLFAELSDGGEALTSMQEMFWGDYYGELIDKFGIYWMINCSAKA